MQAAAAAARDKPKLTDVLGLVAMQGQADIVARVGLGLNRFTWSDHDLWRACINVVLGETKVNANDYDFESTARTRLMMYLERGRADLVELALGYGADPNLNITFLHEEKVYTIRTPLQSALENTSYSFARLLLEHGADPNQAISSCTNRGSDETPLELASKKDSLPIVRLLVDDYGAKVPGAFPLGEVVPLAKIPLCRPLASAIRNNNLSMVRYFVEIKGVRMNYPNPENFEWKEDEQRWNEENGMIDQGDLVSYLEDALSMDAASISLEIVTYLLDAGAVMNFIGSDSESPLCMAVDRGRMDVVTLLLARGADPNLARGWNQESPIIVAAKKNDLQMATVLVGAGGNVLAAIHEDDMQDTDDMMEEGYTALHHFAEHRNAEGVALMLREDAEIDAETFSGLTPLLLVAQSVGKKASAERIAAACACSRLLVNAGAYVNHVRVLPDDFFDAGVYHATEESRFSALTYATELNAPALVRCLIGLGADITQCTEHSFTLLMRAASKGRVDVLAILVTAMKSLPQAQRVAFLDKEYQDESNPGDVRNGRNALHFCMKGDLPSDRARCVNILTDAGVSALCTDRRGKTLLDLALKINSADIVKMILVASHLGQVGSVIDVNIANWLTKLTVGGVSYSVEVNALCYLVMNGLSNLCARFCSRLTKAQIDQAYKCKALVRCVGSDGVASFEVRTAHYSALTLALQHSDACAKVLIEHGASPLAPSPLSGLPDLSLANSPLMQAIEKGSGELVSLLATSLLRLGLATNMLVQAAQGASAPTMAALLAAMKRRPNSRSVHPLTPRPGGVAESPLVDALRLKNLKMAKAIVASMDARQLGLTDPEPEPRDVKLCLEVKVPAFVYRNPWVKVPAGPGQAVSVNFLGWKLEYSIPHGAAPGQTIRIAETATWCPPPTSALDVALRLIAAEDTSERDRKQLRGIAETLLAQKCRVTDSHLDLLIYCAQLGPRAEEVFNLVSKCLSADHKRERDSEGKEWMNEDDDDDDMEEQDDDDEVNDDDEEDEDDEEEVEEEEEPFTWERAVSDDWPCSGNGKCCFVGLI